MTHVSPDDLHKSVVDALKTPNEDIARTVLANAGLFGDDLTKAQSTTGTGLVAYDLQAPAKNLYPVSTPIRNRIPRVGGGAGTATNWRQVSAIAGSGYDSMGWVPEGVRSGVMSYTTANKSATYVTLGEEDYATFEAISAGRGFEDIQAKMTMRLLQKAMLKEEFAILGGNNSNALGTPATPTLSSSGTGGSLGSATYSVAVVALTLEGWFAATRTGVLKVETTKTVTSADGTTFTVNGGSSQKSAAATQAVTSPALLFANTTAVQGAVGYAWYVGLAGAEKLEAFTTINSVKITALAGTGQALTAITADNSTNSLAFDGLHTSFVKSGSGSYFKALATGTAGTGTVLTASGRGSVTEIDVALQTMWDAYQVTPTVLYVNSQELTNISAKVLSSASSPLLSYFNSTEDAYRITAGGTVSFYYNPYMLDGGMRIPVKLHPMVPPGTILMFAENLPVQYQSNEVPNVAEVKTRQDFYRLDWPLRTRRREVGVYVEEVLAVYAPFAGAVIANVANG